MVSGPAGVACAERDGAKLHKPRQHERYDINLATWFSALDVAVPLNLESVNGNHRAPLKGFGADVRQVHS